MFNRETVAEARNADLGEYLRAKGHLLKSEGKQFRVEGVSGLIIVRNYWYNHVMQTGGNALDYAIHVEGLRFREAVAALKEYARAGTDWAPPEEKHKDFKPPPKNGDSKRAIAYLTKVRGIPYEILRPYIDNEMIYEAQGSHNVVFTGADHETGKICYAFQRSSNPKSKVMFESYGSNKKFAFNIQGSGTLLVFESAIDLFSYKSMRPGSIYKDAYWLSLGGLSSISLDHTIRKTRGLENIIFCLDSDNVADGAYERLGWRYAPHFNLYRHKPVFKDWNEQLIRGGDSFPAPPIPWEEAL